MPRPRPARPDRRTLLAWGGALSFAAAGCRAGGARAEDEQAELDERLSDLQDESGRYRPIEYDEKVPRLARLARLLGEAELDALLVEPGATLDYLCDVRWGRSERLFALVVLADGRVLWVVPAFEAPRAERRIAAGGPPGEIVAWDEHEYAWEPLAAALRAHGVKRIAIEPQARAFVVQRMSAAFGAESVVPGIDAVRRLRGRKEPRELELLRAASELTQRAIAAVAERVPPGIDDHELGRWMERAQERLGLRSPWVLPLLGESAAFPHGEPEGRRLEAGTNVLVDTGGSLHGYQSDITRTWVFGAEPARELERAWNAVRDAQQRGFEALRPGTTMGDVDRAARAVIEGAGYGAGYAAFSHRLGHGIGLEGHEEPYLDGGNALALEPGMTFSDEPGIYLAGELGVRLEDIVVVTESGGDHFGRWQVSPRAP